MEFRERLQKMAGLNDKTSAEVIAKFRAKDYVAVAEILPLSSPHNKAVLWSGSLKKAMRFANKIGGTVMEQTPGGKVFNNWKALNKFMPDWTEQSEIWKALSKKFASQISGTVHYVHKKGRQGAIYRSIERKEVMRNKANTKIIKVPF